MDIVAHCKIYLYWRILGLYWPLEGQTERKEQTSSAYPHCILHNSLWIWCLVSQFEQPQSKLSSYYMFG